VGLGFMQSQKNICLGILLGGESTGSILRPCRYWWNMEGAERPVQGHNLACWLSAKVPSTSSYRITHSQGMKSIRWVFLNERSSC